ncbi:MAG: hypothetical protein QM662_19655, partial [Gordonia sp. (in: high G+C Gram-positive bacteria)]
MPAKRLAVLATALIAGSVAVGCSETAATAGPGPSNSISTDESIMLHIEDLPGGYGAMAVTDPYVPLIQDVEREKSSPSSPEGCHAARLTFLEDL